MDVQQLRARIAATLVTEADARRQAELELKRAEEHPGFTDALLDILQTEPDSSIRISTVVYLKNRVNRGWSVDELNNSTGNKPIPEDEKARFRERLLPLLASSQSQIRSQLIPVLQKILHYDFPENWPGFMDITLQLLNTNEAPSIFAGLQCLLAICRVFRYKAGENRADFENIIQATFPRLLTIGTGLINETSDEAGEMLHILLKAYKHATFFDLAACLREQSVMVGWCSVFLQTVSKEPPPSALSDDFTEREANHWWKAKKWAYYSLNRLFVRYGNPNSITKIADDYTDFAKNFSANFAPEILKGYLQQIEGWVAKTTWLSRPCLSYTLVFLDECVKPKAMWQCLKPHLDSIVTHFVFPVMCLSPEDVERFDSDPEDYLHHKLNYYEEVSAPDVAATNFLVTLTKVRRKNTFTILAFVNSIVTAYEQEEDGKKNHIAKEGALRMIGTLSSVILGKKSPIAEQVEYFLVRYVFPDFRSPQGYLRARACDTVEKFEQLDFKEPQNLLIIYRNILECMADPELPVRVEAALALQPLIRHDIIRTNMQQNIPQIMQQLLKLANEVDVDALSNVMEDFVEVFATELTPFAVALSEQLRDTYLRIIRELLEKNNERDDDDSYGDYLDDKSITALGVLQTIGTLILTLESTPDVLLHMESILMPVIQVTLDNKLYDLYNEVFEIIDSCTFAAKSISPTMWQAFALIHRTFKAGAELYLEDMLPALDNFVQYGAQHLAQTPQYMDAMFEMVSDMFSDDKVGGVDRICACKLAEAMMLSLRGAADKYVMAFIEMAMTTLSNADIKVKTYKIHLIEMVVNAIYYNPILTLQVLESRGWTNKFFSLWFANVESFIRVHDKKLSIAAIIALLNLDASQIPVSVQPGWPRLLTGIVSLFKTLPQAQRNREEALRDDAPFNDDGTYGDDDDDEWAGDDNAWTEEADENTDDGEGKDESNAYLEFLNEEAQKFSHALGDEEDDEFNEEVLLETPLDKIEPYQLFKDTFLKLQSTQPQLYSSLTSNLDQEQQNVLQGVVQQADQNAAFAAQAMAAIEANGGLATSGGN